MDIALNGDNLRLCEGVIDFFSEFRLRLVERGVLLAKGVNVVQEEHTLLSSDAGEPLFPNSVECIRLIRAYMQAFGLCEKEIQRVSCVNPGALVGYD